MAGNIVGGGGPNHLDGLHSENGGAFGSLEIWGMWRPQGGEEEVAQARLQANLQDALPRVAVSSRVTSGIQLREAVLSTGAAALQAQAKEGAAASMLLLQHIFDPSVSLLGLRPESIRVAVASSLRTLEKWSYSAEVAQEGLCALACIFQCCAAIEGTASRAAGRTITQIIDQEKGWQVVPEYHASFSFSLYLVYLTTIRPGRAGHACILAVTVNPSIPRSF